MKKIFVLLAIVLTLISQILIAQKPNAGKNSDLLTAYYGVKNALVAGNSKEASIYALQMVKAINDIDSQKVKTDYRDEILVDASHISKSKDIHHQREHFARLSANMFTAAKAGNFSHESIYYDYCPMKKSYWLSNTSVIKNPYYGNQMLSCGKVSEILQ